MTEVVLYITTSHKAKIGSEISAFVAGFYHSHIQGNLIATGVVEIEVFSWIHSGIGPRKVDVGKSRPFNLGS